MKLLVTAKDLYTSQDTFSAIKRIAPSKVKPTGFRAVFLVEDDEELLKKLNRLYDVGRAVLVLKEVESRKEKIEKAVVKVGLQEIGRNTSFCFRLHKRGAHSLIDSTPALERDIGGALYERLKRKYGKAKVDLEEPEVMITAELLGRRTLIGMLRKEWLE